MAADAAQEHGVVRRSRTFGSLSFIQLLRGTRPWVLAAIFALSAVGGVSEAILLILIVQVGTAAVGGQTNAVLQKLSILPPGVGPMILTGIVIGVITMATQLGAVALSVQEATRRSIRMRKMLLHKYLRSSVSGQESLEPGELQELASQGVTRAADGFVVAATAGANATNLLMLIVAAVFVSPIAAIALVGVGVILAGLFIPLSKASVKLNRGWVGATATFASRVSVIARLGVESRVFGVDDSVERSVDGQLHSITSSWIRGKLVNKGSPAVFRITILLVAFAVLGIVLITAPAAVGAVAVIALLLVRALSYVQGLQQDAQSMHELAAHAERVQARIAALPDDDVRWGSGHLTEIRDIELQSVSFGYAGRVHLHGVEFVAHRGELIAISGSSGGGKSTLLKVLLRLVQPVRGSYHVNAEQAESLSEDDWFSRVAYLPQEVRLVPGTIADNVRFFREASDAEVSTAIERAALVLDPLVFGNGPDSWVSDDGRNLSGGQRQRIGLARALLKSPQLLVLDEPTSALDPSTELSVVETIRSLKRDMITVLVTHQPLVVDAADRAYEMRSGILTLSEGAVPSGGDAGRLAS
ncbi:ABC transporter ATP-binding protein [Planctomonas sp. JC2975]|uniref:ATP-binding cassette domain-containing protein n=1 Tax=Planctomonas sp. JC2975 TaxID=2729626 RepID=UPI001472E989|nr:ABC transporter ATP-binding protein [Planctomonas sp. JC2975]NNC12954.1 ABC transporter ATP-binding protein [Planctomonas sp. JC2975]